MAHNIKQVLSTLLLTAAAVLVLLAGAPVSLFAQKKVPSELQLEKCWEHRIDSGGEGRIAVGGPNIYVVRGDSVIEAVAASTGKLLWTSDAGGSIDSNLVVEGESVYFVRRTVAYAGKAPEAALRAIGASTGITRWSVGLSGLERYWLGNSGGFLTAISQDGEFASFALADGAVRSRRQLAAGLVRSPVFDGDRTFVVTESKQISSFIGGGEAATLARSPYGISTVEMAGEERLYFGDERGTLSALLLNSGKLAWQFKSGGGISDIVEVAGRVIAASNDNFVYALAPYNGRRLWKRRVTGRVAALRAVGSDTLLVQPSGGDNVILLTIGTGKVVGQIRVDAGEFVTGSAIPDANRVVIVTDAALYSYGIGGCPVDK